MTFEINKNFARLYGIMLGDGCLSLFSNRKGAIVIAGSIHDDVPFFEKILQPSFKKIINKIPPIRFRPSRGAIYLHFMDKELFDYFFNLGFPIGKKGINLSIPQVFYEKALVKYVLQGFFATDGSLVLTNNNGTLYPRVEANGISQSLIKEIHLFLVSLGISSNFYEAKRKNNKGDLGRTRQQQYRIQINGKENLKKFVNLIGFINPKQIEKLNRYYGYTES